MSVSPRGDDDRWAFVLERVRGWHRSKGIASGEAAEYLRVADVVSGVRRFESASLVTTPYGGDGDETRFCGQGIDFGYERVIFS
jgi:hypothetical protein